MKEGFGRKAGWWSSRQWRERAQSRGSLSGIKLVLAWAVLGILMLIGFFVGLIFLLLGWILMPLLRYGWLKRAHRRGFEAGNPSVARGGRSTHSSERVIEGEYQVRRSDLSD